MRHLNYGHLMYFWRTAREGGVARAAEVLHVIEIFRHGARAPFLNEREGHLFDLPWAVGEA